MAKYKYSFHEERGTFRASLSNSGGEEVWSVSYPDYVEDTESGEMIESNTIFDDGFMKDAHDIDGLQKYLTDLGILKPEDEIVVSDDEMIEPEAPKQRTKATIEFNEYWGTWQVYIDGSLYAEFDNEDDAKRYVYYGGYELVNGRADDFIKQVKDMHNAIAEVVLTDGTRIQGKDLMVNGGVMAGGGGIKSGNVPAIEKRVEEVNRLIKEGNQKGLDVVDSSSTWEAPMKYKPLKYTNGVLYIEYEELDLYKYMKGHNESKWVQEKYKIAKSGMGIEEQKETLNNIARMYRRAIRHFNTYGYAGGGKVQYYDKHNEYKLGRPSRWIEKDIVKNVKYNDNDFVGNFAWKTLNNKYGEGYLYSLDDYDKDLIKGLKLKDAERVFRYFTRTTAIGGIKPLIKINIDNGMLYFMKNDDENNISFETKGVKADYINLIENKYADGGAIKWQDVNVGDSANVKAENRTGLIVHTYGRKFHLRFVDGSEKTYDASELQFFKDEDEFAKGGLTEHGLRVHDEIVKGEKLGGGKKSDYIIVKNAWTNEKAKVFLNTGERDTVGTYADGGRFSQSKKKSSGMRAGHGAIVTDRADRQRIINSIREGETILRGKVKGEQREAIIAQVRRDKQKLGLKPDEKMPYGFMQGGGNLEAELKSKLKGSYELPISMAVYVPSTDKANERVSKGSFGKRIDEVQETLSRMFGGFSSTDLEGGYMSNEKGLIQENVARVSSFGSEQDVKAKFKELIATIKSWCDMWGQESMGFEIEGDMFYINGYTTDAKNQMFPDADSDNEKQIRWNELSDLQKNKAVSDAKTSFVTNFEKGGMYSKYFLGGLFSDLAESDVLSTYYVRYNIGEGLSSEVAYDTIKAKSKRDALERYKKSYPDRDVIMVQPRGYESGGEINIRLLDTVARVEDPRLADPSAY